MTDSSGSEADTRRLDALLDVCLAGTASSADIAELDDLYRARGGDLRRLEAVKRYWTGGLPEKTAEYDRQREALIRRVVAGSRSAGRGVAKSGGGVSNRGAQTLRRLLEVTGLAVSVVLVFLLVSYKASIRSETTRTYTTRSGQQATFTLSDGTRVTLAPRTTLRLAHFGGASRAVTLEGQAYFEVARAAGAPFVVRTGSFVTQVLGTAFLVRHYVRNGQVHVAVADGKVSVTSIAPGRRPMASPLVLTTGHVSDITDSTVVINAVDDLTPETDWLRGQLIFRNVSVHEVLTTLSQWYGYKFLCCDSTITSKSVTLALDARSSAAALSSLEQFLRVRLTVVGDTVTLTPRAFTPRSGATRKQVYDLWIPTREVGR